VKKGRWMEFKKQKSVNKPKRKVVPNGVE